MGRRYDWLLPDQYIEVTGVPDGSYILETIDNPDKAILEADYSNNCDSVFGFRMWGRRIKRLL
jgi:hypothetical protein